jgi:ABC-type multidrug transport system fused ATPase/permease subunit
VISLISKILDLFTPAERRQGVLVLGLVIVMAFLETMGVASILPFLAVLGNPAIVETNPILAYLYQRFQYSSTDEFLRMLAVSAFAVVIFAAVFRIGTQYVMHRYTQMRRHAIGARLLETYLRQPYEFFLRRHSAEMASGILSEVDVMVQYVFTPGFSLIAYSFVCVTLIGLLVVVDPWMALAVGALIGGLYACIYAAVKGVLGRIGKDLTAANRERFTAAGEALGGIKAIKLLGCEIAYLQRFVPSSVRFAQHQATNATLSQVPKYLIEAVGVGGVLLLAIVLLDRQGGLGAVLPVLGLYAFAGYRLLPAAQHIYAGISNVRFGAGAVERVHHELHLGVGTKADLLASDCVIEPRQTVEFRGVAFRYPGQDSDSLRNLSFVIRVGESVGIVGGTGAGKTTLVDILLGLLRPTRGQIVVDGQALTDADIRAWQRTIGYVPQDIFLTDSSVAENIAFGIERSRIDRNAVTRSARLAHIDDFIMSALPEGYDTPVGERGVRLSGGQRQRIGIARALYADPQIIVFDEATSALDNATERAVITSINDLAGARTVVMIAHRLSTVRRCDRIIVLDNGEVSAIGSYDELERTSSAFRALSRAGVGDDGRRVGATS